MFYSGRDYSNKGRVDKKEAIRRRRELVMRDEEIAEAYRNEAKIKAKLEVSQPGDAQEKEADTIARKVVDGSDGNIPKINATNNSVQTKSEGDTLRAPESLQRSLDNSKGQGQSLPENVQSNMGGKMGADLSDVKIHTGSNAHDMSESVNAKAFTHGQDIYFKNGNYNTNSSEGKELLAHEVVHTVQNKGGGAIVQPKIQRKAEDPEQNGFTKLDPQKKGIVNTDGDSLLSSIKPERNSDVEAVLISGETLSLLYQSEVGVGWYYAQVAANSIAGYIEKSKVSIESEKISPEKELINKKTDDINSDINDNKNENEKKGQENAENEKNTNNKGKNLKNKKDKKDKTDKKFEKKSAKGKGDKKGKNETGKSTKPLDFSDLHLLDQSNIPDLSYIRTISDLKSFASSQKAALEQYFSTEETNLNLRVTKNQAILDNAFTHQTKNVTLAYDKASSRILSALESAKTKAAATKKLKLALLKKNETDKTKSVDETIELKQKNLTELAEKYSEQAIKQGEDIKTEAEINRSTNKGIVEKNAEDAVMPYSNHAKLEHIVEEVGGLANDTKGKIDEATNSLNDELRKDSNDLAQKFRDDAKTTVDNLPQGKDEVKKQIKAIYDQGVLQFDGVSDKPLAVMIDTLTKMNQNLLVSKKQALALLADKKLAADAKVLANKQETLSGLRLAKQQAVASIDKEVSDAEGKAAQPKANEEQIVTAARDKIAQSLFPLKKGMNSFLTTQSESLQLLVNQSATEINTSGDQSVTSANQTADSAEKAADDTVKNISGAYDEIIKKLVEAMTKMVKGFADGLQKTIDDLKTKWDGELKDGKEAMKKKAKDVTDKNNSLASDSKSQLVEKAKDASEFTWGDFWMGVLGVLVGIIAAILVLVVLALLVMAILPFLASLFVSAITLLCGEAFALFFVYMATLIGPILLPYILGGLTALGVYLIGKDVVETYKDPSKSSFEKGAHYGFDFVNLILSFLPFTKVKVPGKFGALLGLNAEEAPTVKSLFSKFWKRNPKIASGVEEDPMTFITNQKQFLLTERQEALLTRVRVKDEFGVGIAKIGKREVTATDLAALTNNTRKEYAIIMSKDGDRFLVEMATYKGGKLPKFTDKLLMHSHPNDYGTGMAIKISPEDIEAVELLNQKYSYMVTHDGQVWRFTKDTPINGPGELIRDLNYTGWFNPK